MQGITVRFSFIAFDTNVNELKKVIDFCRDNDFYVTHSPFKFKGKHMPQDRWQKSTSIDFMREYIAQLPLQAKDNLKRQMQDALQDKAKEQICPGLSTGVAINPEGAISPCLSFFDMKIGNLVQDPKSLREILFSSAEYMALQQITKNQFSPCHGCEYKAFCIICPGRIHSQTGKIEKAEMQACNYARAVRELLDE
jgi:radical SAM protein with 4Fe4S-binding SPASM domain